MTLNPSGPVRIDSAAEAATLKACTEQRASIDLTISADMTVPTFQIATQAGSAAIVRHTAGKITAATEFDVGHANSNTIDYEMSGEDTKLETALLSVSLYKGTVAAPATAVFTVRDGASISATNIRIARQGLTGGDSSAAVTTMNVLDGASVDVSGVFFVSNGGVGHLNVSNATLTATKLVCAPQETYPEQEKTTLSFLRGANVNVETFEPTLYKAPSVWINQQMGAVATFGTFHLGGAEQSASLTPSTNNVYLMKGGSLTVKGKTPSIGRMGQAELRLQGGTTSFPTAATVLYLSNVTNLASVVYPPSVLEISGDAVVEGANVKLGLHARDAAALAGKVRVETSGGEFDATFGEIVTASGAGERGCSPTEVFAPTVTATGLAPIKVNGNVTLNVPLVVSPSATKDASGGTYEILTWSGNLTLQKDGEFVLAGDANDGRDQWALTVDTAGKRVLLKLSRPAGLKLVIR